MLGDTIKFTAKRSDVLISQEFDLRPYDIPIKDYINELLKVEKHLVNIKLCYPESITIRIDGDYGCGGISTYISGFRPENEKEMKRRLNKAKHAKDIAIKYKKQQEERKYKEYLKLKKEFENK